MDEPFYLRRSYIFPKNITARALLGFISVMIPLTYWFELWVIMPYFFSNYPLLYWSCFILGNFILHNVVGNLLAVILLDTSIKGRKMPDENEPGVKYCTVCAAYAPPRSFHCKICDTCILKRDHHCDFTGCCIGFYNHRFFVCFVFYLSLSALLCLPFNIYFLSTLSTFYEALEYFSLCTPILVFLIDFSAYSIIKHFYFFISFVNIYGALLSLIWLHYHFNLISKGMVTYEMKKDIKNYNLGTKRNLELVFGKKLYLTLLSPYIKSPLICDGIKFPIRDKE